MYEQINGIPLTNISSTMLLTLYARVKESRSENPIIEDPKAEEIVEKITGSMLRSERKLLRRLGEFKMRNDLAVHAAIRAKQYDDYTRQYMDQYPGCTVVNLGCGMDTRFWRVDNGRVRFFDLDLPPVIELKRSLLPETGRYRMVGSSVFDRGWMDAVLADRGPVIFLAEGLFMYLPRLDVVSIVADIASRVRSGQLIAEVVHEKYTRGFNGWIVGVKFRYEFGFGEPISYQCGIADSDEMESWSPHLHLIDDWCYFDAATKKLGWLRMLGRIEALRKTQWTVRYRIGE